MNRRIPDPRVRFFFPSAIPRRFGGRLAVIAGEALVVFLVTCAVALPVLGTALLAWVGVGIALVVDLVAFALFVPMNEWIHRRWLALGVIRRERCDMNETGQ